MTLFDGFRKGCKGVSYYEGKKLELKYSKVLFVGKSLGGAYVPLLPKFDKNINELAVFCPAVDQSEQGVVSDEETNGGFMREMESGGYYHLYRGVLGKRTWWKHLEDKDGLSPMDNIACLGEAKMFIAHGKKDKCIHYSKSVKYYERIMKIYPGKGGQFVLRLYPGGDHGPSMTNLAIQDFLDWIL